MNILVLNCGSSSVKFLLIDVARVQTLLSGLAERLGGDRACLSWRTDAKGSRIDLPEHEADHGTVVDRIMTLIRSEWHKRPAYGPTGSGAGRPCHGLDGIGHRVVHGGEQFTDSVLIDDEVVRQIELCSDLAPLHNPANLIGIRVARAALADVPQVAVFDTAFHQSLPPRAYRYAVPQRWHHDFGVRRYGFHGTSFRFVVNRAAEQLDRSVGDLALIVTHLGNGCSAAAVLDGECVDTTMGLTPLEGLVMGTRSGDVDPGLLGYVSQRCGQTLSQLTDTLNKQSGLLGLSGLSNDMRTLIEAASFGHDGAKLAIDVFCYRLAKTIAALTVPLGRLDAVVFTGGIGEHADTIRAQTIGMLATLDLTVDPERNRDHGRASRGVISEDHTLPVVMVVATDEERMIAQDTARIVGSRNRS